jgi:hypothetical protein
MSLGEKALLTFGPYVYVPNPSYSEFLSIIKSKVPANSRGAAVTMDTAPSMFLNPNLTVCRKCTNIMCRGAPPFIPGNSTLVL